MADRPVLLRRPPRGRLGDAAPVRRALAAHLRRLRRGGAPRRGLATARGALPTAAAARARAALRGLLPRGGRTSRDGLRLNFTAPLEAQQQRAPADRRAPARRCAAVT